MRVTLPRGWTKPLTLARDRIRLVWVQVNFALCAARFLSTESSSSPPVVVAAAVLIVDTSNIVDACNFGLIHAAHNHITSTQNRVNLTDVSTAITWSVSANLPCRCRRNSAARPHKIKGILVGDRSWRRRRQVCCKVQRFEEESEGN